MVNDYLLTEECTEGTNKTIFVGAIQQLHAIGRSEYRKVNTCLHFDDMGYHCFRRSKTISQETANDFTHPLFKNWKFLKFRD